jgi:hypothetical protein
MTKVPKRKGVISVLRAALQKSPFETLEILAAEYGNAELGFTERKHYCFVVSLQAAAQRLPPHPAICDKGW